MAHARLDFAARNTPLEPADRLAVELGLARGALWVKRDDLTGLAGGGNKARKLEYLCADAQQRGCDVLVTGGAAQSNHVRMTAAAGARLGLAVVAVLAGDERPDRAAEGNLALDRLFGAELRWAGAGDLDAALAGVGAELEAAGRRPSLIPLGGSSPIGALGYVECADEIDAELPDALVVCADGSGGTHAGLVAGFGDHGRVLGVNVGFAALGDRLARLAEQTAAAARRRAPVGEVQLDPGQPEPYGAPTEATREALWLAARSEGLALDPVYTGRAMAALCRRARAGSLGVERPVVFLHSGGLPGLLVQRYADWFAS
ncbi:MAG: pyridoxal-phosphate dependent enzyme [Acidimicrobiia bacterium]|nr:pyridoxal-phosphate dependent enzyme [Acidimicrobiia bacterium]